MADINTFGNPTYFNNDVTFYSDVTIGGEFKYDNLSAKTISAEKTISIVGGQSNQILMADGSTTTNYIGVGVGSTPTSSDVGNDGDIWYTLC